jgi:dolichol-phosphate mannosyltransferase
MATSSNPTLSIIVPAYNEEMNIQQFYGLLTKELTKDPQLSFEIVYINDGSRDGTVKEIQMLSQRDNRVRLVSLSRNFGKEIALTAGVAYARGDAVMMIDADGQHPVELIHSFIQKWRNGASIVVGLRKSNRDEGFVKRYGSKVFYKLFNGMTGSNKLLPGLTDYMLIDQSVRQQFLKFGERNRITRGLINSMGHKKDFIEFEAKPRMAGKAAYDVRKLVRLAMNSFISMSLAPLHFSAYAGVLIAPSALVLGIFVIIEQILLKDPLRLHVTGTAMLGILLLFLVGLLLTSQGITALYISQIHTETKARPLYLVDEQESVGI